MHRDSIRAAGDDADADEVALGVVWEVLHQDRKNDELPDRRVQNRVTVSRRGRDIRCRNGPARAASVFRNDAGVESLAEQVGNKPRGSIGGASRREWNKHADRTAWPSLLAECPCGK